MPYCLWSSIWWFIESEPGFRCLTKSSSFFKLIYWDVNWLSSILEDRNTTMGSGEWWCLPIFIWVSKSPSHWDVHSAWPFILTHNATKVWWLSNLLKQAPWQSHRFTPGPPSLYQKELNPPQIPTQIKHTDDITVSPIKKKTKNTPVVLPY